MHYHSRPSVTQCKRTLVGSNYCLHNRAAEGSFFQRTHTLDCCPCRRTNAIFKHSGMFALQSKPTRTHQCLCSQFQSLHLNRPNHSQPISLWRASLLGLQRVASPVFWSMHNRNPQQVLLSQLILRPYAVSHSVPNSCKKPGRATLNRTLQLSCFSHGSEKNEDKIMKPHPTIIAPNIIAIFLDAHFFVAFPKIE